MKEYLQIIWYFQNIMINFSKLLANLLKNVILNTE